MFLGDENFDTNVTSNGNILTTNVSGVILVLFFSPQCQHSVKFINIFKKISSTVDGCRFGMVNVSTHRSLIKKSQLTNSPIVHVPYIVLYINGLPVMSYNGPAQESDIYKFIFDTTKSTQTKQQFVSSPSKQNLSLSVDSQKQEFLKLKEQQSQQNFQDESQNSNKSNAQFLNNGVHKTSVGRLKKKNQSHSSWDSAYGNQ